MNVDITASWLGTIDYEDAWSLQKNLFEQRLRDEIGDVLLLLEHPPTYTLGRRALEGDVVYDETMRARRGIALYKVDRGGRATYHGPGQLVGYPIMKLTREADFGRYDVIKYLRHLEDVLIRTAADLGVAAARADINTGVWIGTNKIGAIGVKITRGVTMHGFAFNVQTDLSMYNGIVPCGLADSWVTSVEAETGVAHPVEDVARLAADHLAEVFGRTNEWVDPETVRGSVGAAFT